VPHNNGNVNWCRKYVKEIEKQILATFIIIGNDSDQSIIKNIKLIPGISESDNKGKYKIINKKDENCSIKENDFIVIDQSVNRLHRSHI